MDKKEWSDTFTPTHAFMVRFMLRLLDTQEKSHWCPVNKRLGGPQNLSRSFSEEKNLFPLPGNELRLIGSPTRSLVIIPTELPRLHMSLNKYTAITVTELINWLIIPRDMS